MSSPNSSLVILLLLIVCSVAIRSQVAAPVTADDVEKTIATLPPDRRTYERFRYWVNSLPPNQQEGADLDTRYREYLKGRGFSEADANAQIKVVEVQSRRLEIERWNRILTADKPAFNTRPNAFLMEMAKGRKPGAALDVGMGQGRNAIWLAQQGWDVMGFDPAEEAVALARPVGTGDFGRGKVRLVRYCGERVESSSVVSRQSPVSINSQQSWWNHAGSTDRLFEPALVRCERASKG